MLSIGQRVFVGDAPDFALDAVLEVLLGEFGEDDVNCTVASWYSMLKQSLFEPDMALPS